MANKKFCNWKNGKSGERYITYDKSRKKKYVVFFSINGKQKKFGYFFTLEEAVMVRDKLMDTYAKKTTSLH